MSKTVVVAVLVVLLSAIVMAQSDTQGPTITSYTPSEVMQGRGVLVHVLGTGLADMRDVSISPADDFTLKVVSADDESMELQINATCTAEVGKRKLTIGGLTADAKGTPLYFFGREGTCGQDAQAAAAAAEAATPWVTGIFPAGGVEIGKTQDGYILGNMLTQVTDIVVVGNDLTATILPGGTDDRLPVEFTASPRASLGGRGLILDLKNGSKIRGYHTSDDVLRFDVVDKQPEPTAPPQNDTPVQNDTQQQNETEPAAPPVQQPPVEQPPAQDCPTLTLAVNGQPLGSTIEPINDSITFSITRAPGVKILRTYVESDNHIAQQALNNMLKTQSGERATECETVTESFGIPKRFPGGDIPITLTVVYSDKDFGRQTMTKQTTLVLPKGKGGWYSFLLTEDAAGALAAKYQGNAPRLNRDFSYDDLTDTDLATLGISNQDFLRGLAFWHKGDKKAASDFLGDVKEISSQTRKISRANLTGVPDTVRSTLDQHAKGSNEIDPEIDTRVYELTHDGKTLIKSKITIEIPQSSQDYGDGYIVIEIPKELAKSASGLLFSEDATIVQDDPVVKWAFQNIPQDQYREYGFTTSGNAQDFQVVAEAAADKPALLTQFIMWLVRLFGG